MNLPITIDRTGAVRDADGIELGRVTFNTERYPEKSRLQIAALREMLKTDKDEFSLAMHRAALKQLLTKR